MPLQRHESFSHLNQADNSEGKRKLGRTLSSPSLKINQEDQLPPKLQQQNGIISSKKKSDTDNSMLKSPRVQKMELKTERRLKLFNKLKK